jgi:hypothetical protein
VSVVSIMSNWLGLRAAHRRHTRLRPLHEHHVPTPVTVHWDQTTDRGDASNGAGYERVFVAASQRTRPP